MRDLEADLLGLEHHEVAEFALECAERVAGAALYPEDVEEVLAIARRYLRGDCSKETCWYAVWELRDMAAATAVNLRAPLDAGWHAASAAFEIPVAVREALHAADYACAASADWAGERAWQRERLAATVSVKQGTAVMHNRSRPSDLAGRQTQRSFHERN